MPLTSPSWKNTTPLPRSTLLKSPTAMKAGHIPRSLSYKEVPPAPLERWHGEALRPCSDRGRDTWPSI
jgi:hypothetical protein